MENSSISVTELSHEEAELPAEQPEDSNDIYQPIDVPESLAPYVRRISLADCRRTIRCDSAAKPSGSAFLGWLFAGEFSGWVDSKLEMHAQTPWLHLSGQLRDEQVHLRYRGPIGHLLVHFGALAPYQLLGVVGQSVAGRSFQASELSERIRPLANDLVNIAAEVERDQAAQLYLRSIVVHLEELAHNPLPVPPYLANAVAMADRTDGAVRVCELASATNVSERQLNREFTRLVGLSPKFYCQVLQLNHALSVMLSGNQEQMADIALQANFTDQAHFNRVFRRFLDTNPLEFLNGDEFMLHHFLGNRGRLRDAQQ